MSDLGSDALGIAAAVKGGGLSAVEVAKAALARIAARDPALNSFTAVTEARALADARAVDARLARGEDPGPLAGVPFAVKNLFDVAGLVTIAGSKIDRERPPATADAMVVRRLAGAGAVLVVNFGNIDGIHPAAQLLELVQRGFQRLGLRRGGRDHLKQCHRNSRVQQRIVKGHE